MLAQTNHSEERLRDRFSITHDELNELYSKGLYIPIGMDSEASHLLFWSTYDERPLVALVGDNFKIITLMCVVYHQSQRRFVFDSSMINQVKQLTDDYYEKKLGVCQPRLIRYKYVFTDLNGSIKFSKDETIYTENNNECFETQKLKTLLPKIRSFISVSPLSSYSTYISKDILNDKVRNAIKNLRGLS